MTIRVSYSESQDFVYLKSNKTMRKDVDINPRLSRNEPLLQVTDFDRAEHIYVVNVVLFLCGDSLTADVCSEGTFAVCGK